MTELAGAWAAPFLTGHAVLVTGGASGIGLGIARAFAEAGAEVTATGMTEAEISAACDWAKGLDLSERLTFRRLDVCDGPAVMREIGGIQDLHALICCAGMIRRGAELDPEVFAKVVDVNLNGAMRCAHAAKPALARTSGSVVMTASMLSFFGGGLVPGYSPRREGWRS